MDNEIKQALGELILKTIRAIDDLPIGSQERKNAISELDILYKLKIPETKMEFESEQFYAKLDAETAEKTETREREDRIRREDLERAELIRKEDAEKQKQKDKQELIFTSADKGLKLVDTGVALLGLAAYSGMFNQGLSFEMGNAFTSMTFKNHLSRGFSALWGK